jgi:hypothetical protein
MSHDFILVEFDTSSLIASMIFHVLTMIHRLRQMGNSKSGFLIYPYLTLKSSMEQGECRTVHIAMQKPLPYFTLLISFILHHEKNSQKGMRKTCPVIKVSSLFHSNSSDP